MSGSNDFIETLTSLENELESVVERILAHTGSDGFDRTYKNAALKVERIDPEKGSLSYLPVVQKLKTAEKGDDYPDLSDSLPHAGIHLKGHGNAIEVHAQTIEEAQALRDGIITFIKSNS